MSSWILCLAALFITPLTFAAEISDALRVPLEDVQGQEAKQLNAGQYPALISALFTEVNLLKTNSLTAKQMKILYGNGHPVLSKMSIDQAERLGVAFRDKFVGLEKNDANLERFATALALTAVGQKPVVKREKNARPLPQEPVYQTTDHLPDTGFNPKNKDVVFFGVFAWFFGGIVIGGNALHLQGVEAGIFLGLWYGGPISSVFIYRLVKEAPRMRIDFANFLKKISYNVKKLNTQIANQFTTKTVTPTSGENVLRSFYSALPQDMKKFRSACETALIEVKLY